MIIICASITGDSGSVLPYMLFIGIFIGIIKNESQSQAIIASLITVIIGSLISTIISLIIVFYEEGGLYAIFLIQSIPVMFLFYIFITIVGGALGYYIAEELKTKIN